MSPMFAFMAVETDIPWPQEEMEIAFDGRSIRIRPGTDTRRADIAVEYGSGESLEDAVCIGNAFLSQLSWQTKMPIRVDQYCGASFPMSGISKLHSFGSVSRACAFCCCMDAKRPLGFAIAARKKLCQRSHDMHWWCQCFNSFSARLAWCTPVSLVKAGKRLTRSVADGKRSHPL